MSVQLHRFSYSLEIDRHSEQAHKYSSEIKRVIQSIQDI